MIKIGDVEMIEAQSGAGQGPSDTLEQGLQELIGKSVPTDKTTAVAGGSI